MHDAVHNAELDVSGDTETEQEESKENKKLIHHLYSSQLQLSLGTSKTMAGQIPGEKIKQLQEAFNKFTDQRGLVKTKNMEMVLKHMGESPSKEDVQDMINQVDKDGTGVCRFPEFLNMMAARVGLQQN